MNNTSKNKRLKDSMLKADGEISTYPDIVTYQQIAERFLNADGIGISGLWVDSAGKVIVVDPNKIISYYDENNLPITPTSDSKWFHVKFKAGLTSMHLSDDGKSMSLFWTDSGASRGSDWKKISDEITTDIASGLQGTWVDSAGSKIKIGSDKIISYYDESNIPLYTSGDGWFNAPFKAGLTSMKLSDDGKTINLYWTNGGASRGSWNKVSNSILGTAMSSTDEQISSIPSSITPKQAMSSTDAQFGIDESQNKTPSIGLSNGTNIYKKIAIYTGVALAAVGIIWIGHKILTPKSTT